MSDDERRRILRMVSEGRLSPEEAAGLLEAVDDEPERDEEPADLGTSPGSFRPERAERPERPQRPMRPMRPGRPARAVVIQIKESDQNKVNIRIPLSLARAAGKFIPRQAQAYLQNYEIDLQQFLEEAGDVEGGTILEVKDGENRVLIAVE